MIDSHLYKSHIASFGIRLFLFPRLLNASNASSCVESSVHLDLVRGVVWVSACFGESWPLFAQTHMTAQLAIQSPLNTTYASTNFSDGHDTSAWYTHSTWTTMTTQMDLRTTIERTSWTTSAQHSPSSSSYNIRSSKQPRHHTLISTLRRSQCSCSCARRSSSACSSSSRDTRRQYPGQRQRRTMVRDVATQASYGGEACGYCSPHSSTAYSAISSYGWC